VAEGAQPEVEGEETERDAEAEQRVADARRQLDSPHLRPTRDRCHSRERDAEPQQRLDAGRIAGHLEAAPPADERDK
jgi:hypothetical protein